MHNKTQINPNKTSLKRTSKCINKTKKINHCKKTIKPIEKPKNKPNQHSKKINSPNSHSMARAKPYKTTNKLSFQSKSRPQ